MLLSSMLTIEVFKNVVVPETVKSPLITTPLLKMLVPCTLTE